MSNLITDVLSIPAMIGGSIEALTGATIGFICYALSASLSLLIIDSITTVVSVAFVSVFLI
ncbi:MAG: hypothetical protein ACR5KV_02015 [Wolbachia sp.]